MNTSTRTKTNPEVKGSLIIPLRCSGNCNHYAKVKSFLKERKLELRKVHETLFIGNSALWH